MGKFTHFDGEGNARMVDVSHKSASRRDATAAGKLRLSPATCRLIAGPGLPKGNPFEVARLAGIQAAKQTSRLIPLCHGLLLDFADVQIKLEDDGFAIESRVVCRRATGVEMEALTAVTVAALTLYDMCKAVDKQMQIAEVRLLSKSK